MVGYGWWNMFAYYGTVEFYLLYKLMEKQERENAGDENLRINPKLRQFE